MDIEPKVVTPVPPELYGAVLAELREAVCGDDGVVKGIANRQLDLSERMTRVEDRVMTFVDPITRKARAALIFGGAGVGGFIAGILVELAVRLLATGTAHAAVAMLGG